MRKIQCVTLFRKCITITVSWRTKNNNFSEALKINVIMLVDVIFTVENKYKCSWERKLLCSMADESYSIKIYRKNRWWNMRCDCMRPNHKYGRVRYIHWFRSTHSDGVFVEKYKKSFSWENYDFIQYLKGFEIKNWFILISIFFPYFRSISWII